MSQNLIQKSITIEGMTCVNCESIIERKLKNQYGIISIKVKYSTGIAGITYDPTLISIEIIQTLIEEMDYKVVQTKDSRSKNNQSLQILALVIIMFSIFTIVDHFGGFVFFNIFPVAKASMGYTMLFGIGLLTSLHCVAMCGGINLSQCIPRQVESEIQSRLSWLRPTFLYNLGRVISYTLVGAMVGALGSVISFSGSAKGIVQLITGAFMIIMGLNMLNVFPGLRKFNPRMPKIFANKINEQKRSNHNSPLYVGLLNGLMPCGPLQAMQLYALSTGNPLKGALSMLVFSLGTVPLMFGIGALSSFLSNKFKHRMTSISAVLVVLLGVVMLSSGFGLSGITFPSIRSYATNNNVAQIVGGVQEVTSKLTSSQYEPITVQKGIQVKWTIQAPEGSINGCNNSIIIPEYNKEVNLEVGDNVIEFTPTKSGNVAFSCWMGMIRSKITVVDDIEKTKETTTSDTNQYKIPIDSIGVANIKEGIQQIEITMDGTGFTPAVIVVQGGIQTEIVINATDISGSKSTLIFPVYYAEIDMKEGENPIYFMPEIDFDFSTIDNSFSAYVKVVEDINNIKIKEIKDQVKDYVPTSLDNNEDIGFPSCH